MLQPEVLVSESCFNGMCLVKTRNLRTRVLSIPYVYQAIVNKGYSIDKGVKNLTNAFLIIDLSLIDIKLVILYKIKK